MLGLLALLALAGAASACTNSNSWDYLMLVTQWPATECMPQNFGCSDYGSFFTLHGERFNMRAAAATPLLHRSPALHAMPVLRCRTNPANAR